MAELLVDDVHTFYGDSYVLQGVSLSMGKGTVVAVLGRNGVGKTTLVRTVIAFTPARRGRVLFAGQDVTRLPAYRIAQAGMALVPQRRRAPSDISQCSRRSGPWWQPDRILPPITRSARGCGRLREGLPAVPLRLTPVPRPTSAVVYAIFCP